MRVADVIVVGGGPAGSSCAWKLDEAGFNVLVLDRAAFPRSKLCAGWVTPEAIADLELNPDDYPHSLMTFNELKLHWTVITATPKVTQHSIRRVEFDDFLLRRAGVTVLQHKVREICKGGDDYIIDSKFRSKYIVGAGGTRCPVYRALFQARHSRNNSLQTATYEQEFAYDWKKSTCHLWFFADGLPGYAWYVPKSNGYINVGLGGMAIQLKNNNRNLREYWRTFVARLKREGLVSYDDYKPKGYSYYLRGNTDCVNEHNAYIVGDAAGLATRDMCEGIGPAIRSGLLAAHSIATGADYSLAGLGKLSGSGLASRILSHRFAGAAQNSS